MKGFKVIKATEPVPSKPLIVVISGLPGAGKTTISWTAEKPFYIDADTGASRAVAEYRPDGARIDNYEEARAFLFSDEAVEAFKDRKTLVVDTVGTLLENVITPYLMRANSKNARDGGLSIQGWGKLGTEFDQFVNRVIALGLDLVLICHAKEEEAGEGKKSVTLNVKGGSKEAVFRSADMIGFVSRNERGELVLDFNKTETVKIAKNTAELPALTVPHYNEPEFGTFLASLMQKTREKMTAQSGAQLAAANLQREFKQRIAQVEDLEAFKAIEAEVEAVELSTVKAALVAQLSLRFANLKRGEFEALPDLQAFNDAITALKDTPPAYKADVFDALKEAATGKGFAYDKKAKAFTTA